MFKKRIFTDLNFESYLPKNIKSLHVFKYCKTLYHSCDLIFAKPSQMIYSQDFSFAICLIFCNPYIRIYWREIYFRVSLLSQIYAKIKSQWITRGPKGHISCTWVQCATFLWNRPWQKFLFTDRSQNTNLVEDVEILLPVKFSWILFSGFREEVENVSANQKQGWPSCFSYRPEKHKLGRGRWDLPVKFRWIPFSGFRGEVENVSANQRPGRPSCFSDRPEKHQLGRGRWDLASCQVSLNSVQRFQRRSRKCLSQSEARAAILFFWSAWKTQTW